MSDTTAERRRTVPGESIRFATATRPQADSLGRQLTEFDPRFTRDGELWMVEIDPDQRITPLLLELFHSVSEWLTENRLGSVEVHFGNSRYTLLHPSEARPSHSAEFLLQRVIQLQTALESRVRIEQAKGVLAGRLRVAVEEAFDLLRHAARDAGRQLHELAQQVVDSDELPPEIVKTFRSWRERHKTSA